MTQPKDFYPAAPETAEVSVPGSPAAGSEPVCGIDLAQYANLMTRLASGQPRGLLLSGAGLDENQWLEVEKTWGLRLAKAAQQGDTETILNFEKGVAEAQRNCPMPDPIRSLTDYAAIVASIERGTPPIAVCAKFGLKLGEFFALQQAWTRRITSDPQLARAFREMVNNSAK